MAGDLSSGLLESMNDSGNLKAYERFKGDKGYELHPMLAVKTKYQKDQAKFREQPRELEDVLSMFGEYEADATTHDPTWSDVQSSVDEARRVHGRPSLLEKLGGAETMTNAFELWSQCLIEAIPSEMGLSVLKSGLQFLFQMWINRIENVEKMLDLLSDIPLELIRTCEFWDLHNRDASLTQCLQTYCKVAIFSLTKILDRLLKHRQKETSDGAEVGSSKRIEILSKGRRAMGKAKTTVVRGGRQIKSAIISTRDVLINLDSEIIESVVEDLSSAKEACDHRIKLLHHRNGVKMNALADVILNLNPKPASGQTLSTGIDQGSEANHPKQHQPQLPRLEQEHNARKVSTKAAMSEQWVGLNVRPSEATNLLSMTMAEVFQTGLYKILMDNNGKQSDAAWTKTLNEQYVSSDSGLEKADLEPAASEDYRAAKEHEQTHMAGTLLMLPQIVPDLNAQIPVSTEYILYLLDIDPLIPIKDTEFILRSSHSLPPHALDHAESLMAHSTFQHWLVSSGSNLIVADGHAAEYAVRSVSPMSVLCASLSASLSLSSSFIVLSYCCSRNTRDEGGAAGPRGMMRILISQLLLSLKDETPTSAEGMGSSSDGGASMVFQLDERLYSDLPSYDPVALCHLFELILANSVSPAKTVFCIIDGFADWKLSGAGDWSDDVDKIMSELVRIVDKGRHGGDPSKHGAETLPDRPDLKILLTTAGRSGELLDVSEERRISLRTPQASGYGRPGT